jgi:hypothetical protein
MERFEKTYLYRKGDRSAPTLKQWLNAAGYYNGSGTDGHYRRNIKNIMIDGIDTRPGCSNPMQPVNITKYYNQRRKRGTP